MATSIDIENLLLGLAWMGEANTNHIHRLWMPDYARKTVNTFLNQLLADGLVTCRRWAIARVRSTADRKQHARPKGPIRQPYLWGLGEHGHKLIVEHETFPAKLLEPRHRVLLDHDTQTAELITRIIELARPARLSGIYIEREARLNPPYPRPIMDALILVRTGGDYDRPNAVPWTKDPYVSGEKRRRYAIENDRGSEALSVLAGKARAYKAAGTNNWLTVYGRPFPIPLILVPSEGRLHRIMEVWKGAWPEGKWLLTTDAWLEQDRWIMYFKGTIRERRLFAPDVVGALDDGDRETP